MIIDMIQAIKKVADANSEVWDGFFVSGIFEDTFTDEQWGENVVVPEGSSVTPDAVRAILDEFQAEESVRLVQLDRAKAYPSIQEQLDMQYWDSINGTTTWADAIAAVKAANPKP
jgi:hypothetical protein